jgi:hypothetical protein
MQMKPAAADLHFLPKQKKGLGLCENSFLVFTQPKLFCF